MTKQMNSFSSRRTLPPPRPKIKPTNLSYKSKIVLKFSRISLFMALILSQQFRAHSQLVVASKHKRCTWFQSFSNLNYPFRWCRQSVGPERRTFPHSIRSRLLLGVDHVAIGPSIVISEPPTWGRMNLTPEIFLRHSKLHPLRPAKKPITAGSMIIMEGWVALMAV